MLSGALALGAQNVLASSPLPCPKGSPINDTIWVLQSDIKTNVQNRLMQIDREKFHQIVVITISSPEDYGYDSLAHMWGDTINKCGIGYRGENTGTIVWYSKKLDSDKHKYFISTASGVSWYITDNLTKRLIETSKESCEKWNVSCNMDNITKSLDAIITKHLAGGNQVQVIQEWIKAHDSQTSSESMENILQFLWLGGLVILVVGGWIKLQNNIRASKAKKELKKKILEVAVKFEQEKAKYPDWFIASHMSKYEEILKEIQNKSDAELENICKSLSKLNQLKNISLWSIENNLLTLAGQYEEIVGWVEKTKQNLESKISEVRKTYSQLEKDGFQFTKASLTIPDEKSNPEATLNSYTQMLSQLVSHFWEISQIPQLYKSMQWFDGKLSSELSKFKNDFQQSLVKYESIYGKSNTQFSFSNLETQVLWLISSFQTANAKKDVNAMVSYKNQSENMFSGVRNAISQMNSQISWYEWIPKEISSLEAKLKKMNPSSEYQKNAKAYSEESWKRKFDGYDMWGKIMSLNALISWVKTDYANKTKLSEIKWKLSTVTSELSTMEEYIWLWAIVATLIAQRIAQEEAERQRQIEAERREAERLRREAEEEAARERRRNEESSRSTWSTSSRNDDSTPDYSPGWGWGGDGWGWWGNDDNND